MTGSSGTWRTPALAGGGAALAGAAVAAALLQPSQLPASAFLAAAMGAIAAEDARDFRIPDVLVAAAAIGGLVALAAEWHGSGADPWPLLGGALLSMTACAGALFLVREAFYRLRGIDGLGLGDVKLAGAAGIWLGWEQFAFALLIATGGALLFVAARRGRDGSWRAEQRIPLGAFLAPAIWICWVLARLPA